MGEVEEVVAEKEEVREDGQCRTEGQLEIIEL
jgi:hypothetical protein